MNRWLAVLVVLRAVIEVRLADIRNRMGYELSIEIPAGPDIKCSMGCFRAITEFAGRCDTRYFGQP